MTVDERPELEQARTMRSPESIHASRMVEINKWRERGVVEKWSREATVAAGGWTAQRKVKIRGQRLREYS